MNASVIWSVIWSVILNVTVTSSVTVTLNESVTYNENTAEKLLKDQSSENWCTRECFGCLKHFTYLLLFGEAERLRERE